MRLTTLPEVYRCCAGDGGEEILLDPEIMSKAKRCIEKMMEFGG